MDLDNKDVENTEQSIEDIKNDFIDSVAEIMSRFGYTRISGQLDGLLFLSQKPLSLDDMASILEVSKSSVSTNIRTLEQVKIVRRVWNRKDRKNYYEIRGEIFEVGVAILQSILTEEFQKIGRLIAKFVNDLDSHIGNGRINSETDTAEAEFLKKRFILVDEYREAIEHLMKVVSEAGGILTPKVLKKIKISQD